MEYASLNTGARIPLLGFGTASTPLPLEEISHAIASAIQVGYRHFDTASVYPSEQPLGIELSRAFAAGIVKREDVFVTSKLWADDNHPDDVIPALRKSLKALQLDYLDLYLIHCPVRVKKGVKYFSTEREEDFLPLDLKGTWKAMEECVELGMTKAIGVSNFSSKKLQDILTYAKIPPAVNQVEMHPKWQQQKLREFCKAVDIQVSAWSPLGAPTTPWGVKSIIDDVFIKQISQRHGKTPAQVLLRWGIEQGASVLPKSYNKDRMAENFQIFDFHLTREDYELINKIEQKKTVAGEFFCNATTSPYKTIQEFWDGEI